MGYLCICVQSPRGDLRPSCGRHQSQSGSLRARSPQPGAKYKKAPSFLHLPAPSTSSKPPKATRPIPAKFKMVNIPRIPQEIIDEILGRLAPDADRRSLQDCALVSKSWLPSCQRNLFHTISFTCADADRWLETFPVPEESPAHLVRNLSLTIRLGDILFGRFPDYLLWFTSVGSLTLNQPRVAPHSSLRLPRSVTSLTLKSVMATIIGIRDVLAQLPNLDDLALSGFLVPMDRSLLPGMGTVLKGRFGGRLRLLGGLAHENIMNMLLEIPTGIHFTEIRIRGVRECSLSVVRLVGACRNTLVKLSFATPPDGKFRLLPRSGRI